ncbi:2840_t:CDS:2 [Ambispora gerdemannii]|uniref:2840_t:CDS:1 n=1 Tax=Ambispora gerdemannii TaxID=144530 RepID=A0A9N9GFQ0_9GLOM|nr:2840_t:CDS:2 [Ambispora gerdemannii]
MSINLSQQHLLDYSEFAYGDETYYNESYLPFVEFQMTNQQKICSLLTTTKEHFSITNTTTTAATDDNDMTNKEEAPSRIILSLVNYVANEFDQDLNHRSCESPGLLSSSSTTSPYSDPQTPVNQSIAERRNRLDPKDNRLSSSTTTTASITTDIKTTTSIQTDTTNTDTVSVLFRDSDNYGGALLNDDIGLFEDSKKDSKSSSKKTSPTNLSIQSVDSQKGFFKMIFRSGKSPLSQNTCENKNDQRTLTIPLNNNRMMKSPETTTELTPQQQYQLNMRRHLEQALYVARKKSVAAAFRREVCPV